MLWPAVTGSGVSVLVTTRSAEVWVLVVAVVELLDGFWSGVLLVTEAMLISVVLGGTSEFTWATMMTTVLAPLASVPRLAVTVLPLALPWLDDTKVVPVGSTSVSMTFTAGFGPALLTVTVYVTFWPGMTGSGESVLVTERSAETLT